MIKLRGQITGLLLIPAIAVLLPWSIFFFIARGLSRFSWLFKAEMTLAIITLEASSEFEANTTWRRHYRLYKIVDAADPWLCRFRGRGWIHKHVDIKGEWPINKPFVASSIHFGAGLWALRHIRETRSPISMVLRPHAEWREAFSTPMRYYLIAYEKAIVNAGGGAITHTGAGLKKRFKAGVEASNNQLVLIDVPSTTNTLAINFLGRPTYFASGLINLSQQIGLPIVPYVMTLDFSTGRRQLTIGKQLENGIELQQAMQELADFFDPFVRQQSEGWQLWGQYSAFVNAD